MAFIEGYKRLEKLCGEILNADRGISAYIEEMINTPRGAYLVRSWDEDLKQLKHYRWVRNKIAHEPGCAEENMCSDADTQWILEFHQRIMNQTDPLALYRKATQPQQKAKKRNIAPQQNQKLSKQPAGNGCLNCLIVLLILAVVAIIALRWLLQ